MLVQTRGKKTQRGDGKGEQASRTDADRKQTNKAQFAVYQSTPDTDSDSAPGLLCSAHCTGTFTLTSKFSLTFLSPASLLNTRHSRKQIRSVFLFLDLHQLPRYCTLEHLSSAASVCHWLVANHGQTTFRVIQLSLCPFPLPLPDQRSFVRSSGSSLRASTPPLHLRSLSPGHEQSNDQSQPTTS